ncbi:hypothetical protein [Chengkuizengella sediminis]|uniref:hypothetical protein n=1 Tax=Chengkuizengella sediminis TaxID=1885917 RepID=UPI00138A67D2|nr:hypothetical protein [Chengkuizengella sediminis]
MGAFDRTICDCCVCPMQCVLKQLVREEVRIFTLDDHDTGTLTNVDNFIATLDDNGDILEYPIGSICAVSSIEPFDFKLKPIRKNVKGECSCIEDPTTKLAESKIGKSTTILAGDFNDDGIIIKVGEGIVILLEEETTAISSCKIQRFGVPQP